MTFNQMMKLKNHVDKIPRAAVKDYLCTLSKNNIVPGEGNMVSDIILLIQLLLTDAIF
jgi:hypothetical protein